MLTQEQVKKSIRTNTPTKGYVSGVRPTNFVDKKTAFNSYQKAKKDNYVGDFITFVDGLEKKGFPVENSDQIRKSKAKAQYLEQKRKNTQLKMMKKIPISEASTSDIWDDFTKTLGDNFSVAGAPVAGALQGFADIGQGAVGKPVEFMAKKFLGLFGYDDESVESLTTQSDLTKGFNKTGAKIGRETGKIVGTLPIGGGTSSVALKGLKGIPYMKEIAKRLAMGAGEGFLGGVSYNVATTDSIGTPTDLGLTTLIGAGFRGLPIIGNELTPLVSKIPGIKNQLAQKLQLNGLMNRTKIENLQNILRQGGAEDLAMGKPEDVAEWMFQRGLEGNKTTIMSKLDDIAEASMDMVDIKLNKIQGLYKVDTIDNILGMLGKEYDGAVSKEFQDKFKKVVTYLAKNKKGGLEIKEINEIKRMVYKDLNPYTASGKVKASSADVASANRELKNFIEDVAEQAGVTTDGMTIRLLNNEFAMADAMKKAISQKDSLDAVSNVLNFISHSGGPMAIGGIAGSNIGPFDSNTTAGKLGNIVVGALVGKTLASTSVSTKVAKWIRNIPETQKAKILTVLEKGTDNITDAEKNTLLQSFKNLDVDVSDDAFVDFSMKADDIMPDNIPNNVVDSVGEIITAPAVQEQQTLPEMLKQASESINISKIIDDEVSGYPAFRTKGENRNAGLIADRILEKLPKEEGKKFLNSLGITTREQFENYLVKRNRVLRPGINKTNALEKVKLDKEVSDLQLESLKARATEANKSMNEAILREDNAAKRIKEITGKEFNTTGPETAVQRLKQLETTPTRLPAIGTDTPKLSPKTPKVLKTTTPLSKVDDALPTAGKMEQKAKSLDSADLTKSMEKAKAEGKTVEEFVKSKAPKYMREYVDKDGVITEYRYYDHSYPKTFIAKKDIGEGIKKGDIVALVKEKNEINAIHSPYTKGGFKYTIERKVSLDDFTNVIEQTPPTPTPAVGKTLPKVDNTLLSEARKTELPKKSGKSKTS